jgi:hypothetical protein
LYTKKRLNLVSDDGLGPPGVHAANFLYGLAPPLPPQLAVGVEMDFDRFGIGKAFRTIGPSSRANLLSSRFFASSAPFGARAEPTCEDDCIFFPWVWPSITGRPANGDHYATSLTSYQ